MKLTDAERLQVAAAIKHFEALQKRYTKQHNGTACEHVKMALIGLKRMEQEPDVVRCGECERATMADGLPNSEMRWCGKHKRHMYATDFCSYGERRKEQDDG